MAFNKFQKAECGIRVPTNSSCVQCFCQATTGSFLGNVLIVVSNVPLENQPTILGYAASFRTIIDKVQDECTQLAYVQVYSAALSGLGNLAASEEPETTVRLLELLQQAITNVDKVDPACCNTLANVGAAGAGLVFSSSFKRFDESTVVALYEEYVASELTKCNR